MAWLDINKLEIQLHSIISEMNVDIDIIQSWEILRGKANLPSTDTQSSER